MNLITDEIVSWLLKGDTSIQFQVYRDLLGSVRNDLQKRIELEGWGKHLLSKRKPNSHWGDRFYQPKWISSHYTLLDLKNLNILSSNQIAKETIELTLRTNKAEDGGIQLGPSTAQRSDVCVNGMFLNYASYFKTKEEKLSSIVDALLNEIMPDGGFNCRTTRSGAKHSSLHSTISVLEGLFEYQKAGYSYRKSEIEQAKKSAEEFILIHQLFLSDLTGEVINKEFLKFRYPCRWKYDVLRAMDYFQYANVNWDHRMKKAIENIKEQRNGDKTWNMRAAHPGKVHMVMEKAGKPSRWNTLRALRVLKRYENKTLFT